MNQMDEKSIQRIKFLVGKKCVDLGNQWTDAVNQMCPGYIFYILEQQNNLKEKKEDTWPDEHQRMRDLHWEYHDHAYTLIHNQVRFFLQEIQPHNLVLFDLRHTLLQRLVKKYRTFMKSNYDQLVPRKHLGAVPKEVIVASREKKTTIAPESSREWMEWVNQPCTRRYFYVWNQNTRKANLHLNWKAFFLHDKMFQRHLKRIGEEGP